ncbi:MAG: hypothetical protein EDM05_000485 [Leptolyngbya sp. IPPAS B-1204]
MTRIIRCCWKPTEAILLCDLATAPSPYHQYRFRRTWLECIGAFIEQIIQNFAQRPPIDQQADWQEFLLGNRLS